MTEQQIKKAVELAEGFWLVSIKRRIIGDRYIPIVLVMYQIASSSLEDIRKWEHYPLLLYRAGVGFNLKNTEDDYKYINIDADIIDYSNGVNPTWRSGLRGSQRLWYKNYTPSVYLTAQEQALEAALEGVL